MLDKVEICFTDNGWKISKTDSEKVFEKFYRIPTGNRHDVKGFGIGLYYSEKIIEKHGGQVLLQSQPGLTVFKILISNEPNKSWHQSKCFLANYI